MAPAVAVPDDERPFNARRTSAPARTYPTESKARVLYHKLKKKAEKAVSRILRRKPKSPIPAASGYEKLGEDYDEVFEKEWDE